MDTSVINEMGNTLKDALLQTNPNANIERSERYVSLGAGAFIALKGVTNIFSSPLLALSELVVGGALLYRGATGYCPVNGMVDNQSSHLQNEIIPVTTNISRETGKL